MSEQKFLDKTGLSTFLAKLKTIFAPFGHNHDSGTNSIEEKGNEGTRYIKFADLTCVYNYQRLNQQIIISGREESILLNVKCLSTSSNFFNKYSISYIPLTSNCTDIISNIFAGIVNLESSNKIELWYKQPQWGSSIAIIPIGKNIEARSSSLTFYDYNRTDAGNVDAPTFDTAIPLTNMIDWDILQNKPSTFMPSSHTHTKSEVGLSNVDNTADNQKSVKYATTSTTATTATKLGSENKGSSTQPIYLSSGIPTACRYTLEKSVPANAVFTDTTYGLADINSNGLMPYEDKRKLNSIEYNANNYTHPTYYSKSSGLYKITVDSLGHVSATTPVSKSDITALGIPSQNTDTWKPLQGSTSYYDGSAGYAPAPKAGVANRYLRCDGVWEVPPDTNTTYNLASNYTDGLMSSSDKNKLDGVSPGANYYTHPTYTSKYSGLYKISVDSTGHVSNASAVTKNDITALGIPGQDTNTTYGLSSYYSDGLMRSLNNNTSQFMRGDGNWSNIPTTTSGTYEASGGFKCGSVTENFQGKILWSGALWPSNEHTCSLQEYVTNQPHGIVLVFSVYENGAAQDWGFHTFFIPKSYIKQHSGKGMDFPMGTTTFGICANKYLYVGNSAIKGSDTNKATGTGGSGVKYNNGYYVLRYVLGV